MKASFTTIGYAEGVVSMLDQTLLPAEEVVHHYTTVEEVAEAIRSMVIRGAPAIGIAAAFGMVLAARDAKDDSQFSADMEKASTLLAGTRPTAVNLFWALDRMNRVVTDVCDKTSEERLLLLEKEANGILEEDEWVCFKIGEYGAELMPEEATVMTHCNAGALATGGLGTALSVFRVAKGQGKVLRVISNETRPFLQGARLTTWELMRDGIDVTLVADNAAASLIRRGKVDAVIVGTDRTVANGDVANKIGTYGVALAAHESGIPFYVAAPTSTIDLSIQHGDEIEIEERDGAEVRTVFGVPTAPEGVKVMNPAFDVTPAKLVTGIITEYGVARPPYEQSLPPLVAQSEKK